MSTKASIWVWVTAAIAALAGSKMLWGDWLAWPVLLIMAVGVIIGGRIIERGEAAGAYHDVAETAELERWLEDEDRES